jgi:nucleotide-binding universal stress UspA family protein
VPPPSFPDHPDTPTEEKALEDADAYLTGLLPRPLGNSSVETATYYGDVASRIIEEVRVRSADLVVMSTHGRSGLGEWVDGSVATEVIRRADSPVLVVPHGCDQAWSLGRPARMLFPLDGSESSHAVLRPSLELARALGAQVTVMRVVAPTKYIAVAGYPDPAGVPTAGISAGDAENFLNEVIADFRVEHPGVVTYIAEGSDVASTIALAARDQQADVIGMATHGRGGLARLVMGSVATSLIHQAMTPILLVRPRSLA